MGPTSSKSRHLRVVECALPRPAHSLLVVVQLSWLKGSEIAEGAGEVNSLLSYFFLANLGVFQLFCFVNNCLNPLLLFTIFKIEV